jgi:aminoglycoside phosphotransferase (APT) family kinase protein
MFERIPPEVADQFGLPNHMLVRELDGGRVTTTLKVDPGDSTSFVLQRIHPDVNPAQTEDYKIISEHLQSAGWEIPTIHPAENGRYFVRDSSGGNWRLLDYIENDGATADSRLESVASASGKLLARLHADLQAINYKPRFSILNFHNIHYFAEELDRKDDEDGLDKSVKKLADHVLMDYWHWQRHAEEPSDEQLIHGDPKFANMLYHQGQPFTFIDWDTAMIGSRTLDIGDMLRSFASRTKLSHDGSLTPAASQLLEAYRLEHDPSASSEAFTLSALRAAARITLELALRYAADCTTAPEGYFAWDPSRYTTRQAQLSAIANETHRQFLDIDKLVKHKEQELRTNFYWLEVAARDKREQEAWDRIRDPDSMSDEQRDNSGNY